MTKTVELHTTAGVIRIELDEVKAPITVANFLDYVVEQYDQNKTLIAKVNAACREGKYTDALWKELTGKPLAELNDEWKASMKKLSMKRTVF